MKFGYRYNTWEHVSNLLILLGLLLVLIFLFNVFGQLAKDSRLENVVKYVTAIFTFQIYDRFFQVASLELLLTSFVSFQ